MENNVYFPTSLTSLLLGGLNQWKAVEGECRARGREKPGYLLLSHPALWGILSHVGSLWCQLLPDSHPPRTDLRTVPFCVGLNPAGHASLQGMLPLSTWLPYSYTLAVSSLPSVPPGLEVIVARCNCYSLGSIIIPHSAFQLFQ